VGIGEFTIFIELKDSITEFEDVIPVETLSIESGISVSTCRDLLFETTDFTIGIIPFSKFNGISILWSIRNT
jgi:hypothetical protein